MGLVERTKQAFHKAVRRHNGKLIRLQEQTGVPYPTINRLNSEERKFANITVQTLDKLFPEMEVTFFRDERIASETTDPLLREILANWDNLSRGAKHRIVAQVYDELEGETPSSRVQPEGAPASKHRRAG